MSITDYILIPIPPADGLMEGLYAKTCSLKMISEYINLKNRSKNDIYRGDMKIIWGLI